MYKQKVTCNPVKYFAPPSAPPTHDFQQVSIDFGFIMQKLKNADRYKSLEGLNGENCYILVKCRKSKNKAIKPTKNKTLPLE